MAAGDVLQRFGTPGTVTITLASLATNASRLVGRQGTAIDISLLNCVDLQISGKITVGSTATNGQAIEVWAVGSIDGVTYPGPIIGTDAAVTFDSDPQKFALLGSKLVAAMTLNATGNIPYEFNCHSLAAVFGGMLPWMVTFVVLHSAGANLHATAGNHFIKYQPVYFGVLSS